MSRVGILQLLILLLGLGVIGLGIVMTWKGKLRIFAAGLGVFQGFFGIALCERFANAQHGMKTGSDGGREFLPRLRISLAEHVPALGVADQRGARAGLRRQRT